MSPQTYKQFECIAKYLFDLNQYKPGFHANVFGNTLDLSQLKLFPMLTKLHYLNKCSWGFS